MTSRRRKLLFAAIALCGVTGLAVAVLLVADVYVHRRTQELGGVNIWGYRGAPVGRKAPGSVRVAMLGGSTTFGWGLPSRESIPAFLERHLREEPGPRRQGASVVNLGAPGQGAFGFLYDLQDFEYLDYDVIVLYGGLNDLGPYTARGTNNDWLWRRASPIFRATGYFPILPVVLREKAAVLSGGEGAQVVFQPDLATRATATAFRAAAEVAGQVDRQLGHLSAPPPLPVVDSGCSPAWKGYCGSVKVAVAWALGHDKKVLFVTQPYLSDSHVDQQANVTAMLQATFGHDRRLRIVNLGRAIDMMDTSLTYDGVHLVARGNDIIARSLLAPLTELMDQQ